jgi:hypothetical protein
MAVHTKQSQCFTWATYVNWLKLKHSLDLSQTYKNFLEEEIVDYKLLQKEIFLLQFVICVGQWIQMLSGDKLESSAG